MKSRMLFSACAAFSLLALSGCGLNLGWPTQEAQSNGNAALSQCTGNACTVVLVVSPIPGTNSGIQFQTHSQQQKVKLQIRPIVGGCGNPYTVHMLAHDTYNTNGYCDKYQADYE